MKWIYFAGLSAATAGLIPILAKREPEHIDPAVLTALRAVVMTGGLVLAALFCGRVREITTVDRPTFMLILVSGLACAASTTFFFFALRNGPAAKVVAIDRTSAAFTLILAALFLGEALTWRSMLGIGMILAGVLLTLQG